MDVKQDAIDRWALRLALVPGVGPRTRRALLERFGNSQQVLQADRSQLLHVPGVGETLCGRLLAARLQPEEEEVLATCRQHAIEILLDDHGAYPPLLREIPDPPPVLFVAGSILPRDQRSVAIVGTRHATAYGLRQADRLARQLVAAGFTVVSGLARGVDAAAHRGALSAGGRTIAVLGGGLLKLYPPEHQELALAVRGRGAVVSEAPPLRPPSSGNFPQRNRVISGLSLGVIVIEAGQRSGALISARHALEQGREVFALPGSVESPVSRGCHQLLRDGAKLVESVEDVLEELQALVQLVAGREGPTSQPAPPRTPPPTLSPEELAVWRALSDTPTCIDEVIVASGLAPPRALAILGSFEIRKIARRLGGACVVRA